MFKIILHAYQTLTDPIERAKYDKDQHAKTGERKNTRTKSAHWQSHEPTNDEINAKLKEVTNLIKVELEEQKKRNDLGKKLADALKDNRIEVFKRLISEGADLNKLSVEGFACMHYAVNRNNLKLFNYLLRLGADVNVRSANGETALYFAVKNNNYDL